MSNGGRARCPHRAARVMRVCNGRGCNGEGGNGARGRGTRARERAVARGARGRARGRGMQSRAPRRWRGDIAPYRHYARKIRTAIRHGHYAREIRNAIRHAGCAWALRMRGEHEHYAGGVGRLCGARIRTAEMKEITRWKICQRCHIAMNLANADKGLTKNRVLD